MASVVAAAMMVLAAPGVALAGSASTPVGQLTSVQVNCDDPGALVQVTVSGGFPNTSYSAISEDPFEWNGPSTFTTNASGAGSTIVGMGGFHGTNSVFVTANGQTGTVTHEANCDDGWGD